MSSNRSIDLLTILNGSNLVLPGSYIKVTSPTLGTGSSVTALHFSTIIESNGNNITYTSDSVNGDSFKINQSGIYSINATGSINNTNSYGYLYFLRNASSTQQTGSTLTSSILLAEASNYFAFQINCSCTVHLQASDVVRIYIYHATTYSSEPFVASIICLNNTTT